MVRHSYRYEMRSALTFPLAASLAEGSFTSVIAVKNFGASIVLMSVIAAAPMFGNILAMMWSEISIGRRKVPLVNMLQLGVVIMVGSVALDLFLPPQVAGWVFACQIVAARLMASGITTIRAAIWRANYPMHLRGHVVARISTVSTAILAATTLLGSQLLDQNPRSFAFLYPAAAFVGLIGIWQFSHVRVRQESLLRRREQQVFAVGPEGLAATDETNVLNYSPAPAPGGSWFRRAFLQAWSVLRKDKDFREYQRWQFLSGVSFMMFQPSLLYMVSHEMTNPAQLGSWSPYQYVIATMVVQIIPMVFSLLFAPLWAPLFDRMHITRFRVIQMMVALSAHVTMLTGALVGWHYSNMWGLAIVAGAQVIVGITNAAGNLAWNLGHNDFARGEESATYMAVHVMLTGVRGCLAPFIGAALYQHVMGRHLYGLSGIICLISLLGFCRMARRAPKKIMHHNYPNGFEIIAQKQSG